MDNKLFADLSDLGLEGLESVDLYEKESDEAADKGLSKVAEITEKDILFDKNYKCPVCDHAFTAKAIRSGKNRLISTDIDLRPKYELADYTKYDVILCSKCGYAALTRFFGSITLKQCQLIRQGISAKYNKGIELPEVYDYAIALSLYRLTLANAVVKMAKAGEKAYICLKAAWLIRGWVEELEAQSGADIEDEQIFSLMKMEMEYISKAYEGFIKARETESSPICGMDEVTIDYLLAALGIRIGEIDYASRLIGNILVSPSTSNRIKDKARDLKEEILRMKR